MCINVQMMAAYCECGRKAGRNGKCESCSHAIRKAEKNALKEPKKQKPIPKRSAKRIEEDKEYKVLRIEQLTEHPECQIKIMGICLGKADQVHHSGKRGKNYLKKELFKSACGPCHKHVENVMSAKDRRLQGFLTD